jgi:hypothetical protein
MDAYYIATHKLAPGFSRDLEAVGEDVDAAHADEHAARIDIDARTRIPQCCICNR